MKPWRYVRDQQGRQALENAVSRYIEDDNALHTVVAKIPAPIPGPDFYGIHFHHTHLIFPGGDYTSKMMKILYDISRILPDGVRYAYEAGDGQISFNTIGDPQLIFDPQELGNTR